MRKRASNGNGSNLAIWRSRVFCLLQAFSARIASFLRFLFIQVKNIAIIQSVIAIILVIQSEAFQWVRPAWKVATKPPSSRGFLLIRTQKASTMLCAANEQKLIGCCEKIANDGNTADVELDSIAAGDGFAAPQEDSEDRRVIDPLEDRRSRISTNGTLLGKQFCHFCLQPVSKR